MNLGTIALFVGGALFHKWLTPPQKKRTIHRRIIVISRTGKRKNPVITPITARYLKSQMNQPGGPELAIEKGRELAAEMHQALEDLRCWTGCWCLPSIDPVSKRPRHEPKCQQAAKVSRLVGPLLDMLNDATCPPAAKAALEELTAEAAAGLAPRPLGFPAKDGQCEQCGFQSMALIRDVKRNQLLCSFCVKKRYPAWCGHTHYCDCPAPPDATPEERAEAQAGVTWIPLSKSRWIEKYGGMEQLTREGFEVVPCTDCDDAICHGWRVVKKQDQESKGSERAAAGPLSGPRNAQGTEEKEEEKLCKTFIRGFDSPPRLHPQQNTQPLSQPPGPLAAKTSHPGPLNGPEVGPGPDVLPFALPRGTVSCCRCGAPSVLITATDAPYCIKCAFQTFPGWCGALDCYPLSCQCRRHINTSKPQQPPPVSNKEPFFDWGNCQHCNEPLSNLNVCTHCGISQSQQIRETPKTTEPQEPTSGPAAVSPRQIAASHKLRLECWYLASRLIPAAWILQSNTRRSRFAKWVFDRHHDAAKQVLAKRKTK